MRSDPRAFLFVYKVLRGRGREARGPKPFRIERVRYLGGRTSQTVLPRSTLTASRATYQRQRGGDLSAHRTMPGKSGPPTGLVPVR